MEQIKPQELAKEAREFIAKLYVMNAINLGGLIIIHHAVVEAVNQGIKEDE